MSRKISWISTSYYPFFLGATCFFLVLYKFFPSPFALLLNSSLLIVCTILFLRILGRYGRNDRKDILTLRSSSLRVELIKNDLRAKKLESLKCNPQARSRRTFKGMTIRAVAPGDDTRSSTAACKVAEEENGFNIQTDVTCVSSTILLKEDKDRDESTDKLYEDFLVEMGKEETCLATSAGENFAVFGEDADKIKSDNGDSCLGSPWCHADHHDACSSAEFYGGESSDLCAAKLDPHVSDENKSNEVVALSENQVAGSSNEETEKEQLEKEQLEKKYTGDGDQETAQLEKNKYAGGGDQETEQLEKKKYTGDGDQESEQLEKKKHTGDGDQESEQLEKKKYTGDGDQESEQLEKKYTGDGNKKSDQLEKKYTGDGDQESEQLEKKKYTGDADQESEQLEKKKYTGDADQESEQLEKKYTGDGNQESDQMEKKYTGDGDQESEQLEKKKLTGDGDQESEQLEKKKYTGDGDQETQEKSNGNKVGIKLMDLGVSESERNRRLESLIAKRKARKAMERNVKDLDVSTETSESGSQLPSITATRRNPCDLLYDFDESIPGSAPSILLPRMSVFDLSEEVDDDDDDDDYDEYITSKHFITHPLRDILFTRHGSFTVGASFFSDVNQARRASRFRPFVSEAKNEEPADTSGAHLHTSLGEVCDPKFSFTSESDTDSTISDQEHEEDLAQDSEYCPIQPNEGSSQYSSSLSSDIDLMDVKQISTSNRMNIGSEYCPMQTNEGSSQSSEEDIEVMDVKQVNTMSRMNIGSDRATQVVDDFGMIRDDVSEVSVSSSLITYADHRPEVIDDKHAINYYLIPPRTTVEEAFELKQKVNGGESSTEANNSIALDSDADGEVDQVHVETLNNAGSASKTECSVLAFMDESESESKEINVCRDEASRAEEDLSDSMLLPSQPEAAVSHSMMHHSNISASMEIEPIKNS